MTGPSPHVDLPAPFRRAVRDDCRTIARMFLTASDGVSAYVWSTMRDRYPHAADLVAIGAERYDTPDGWYSYNSCVIAEEDGRPIAMLAHFPIDPGGDRDAPPPPDTDPVLAPYCLEEPGSWYICAMAVAEDRRRRGIGSQMIEIADRTAAARGHRALSLLCFERNEAARRLYERRGFETVARRPIVPHPLIHIDGGDVLLMTRSVS